MCTTIGFSYDKGCVFGRTLEINMKLDNNLVYVPKNCDGFIQAKGAEYPSKYAVLGTGYSKQALIGDGVNEMGLMGSNNLLPGYATFSEDAVEGKINLTVAQAFGYLLSRCKDVEEVREEAEKLVVLERGEGDEKLSTPLHAFFMDANGKGIVLEPKEGKLLAYHNPYGIMTNAPEFPWHVTNLRNYLNLQPENVEQKAMNGVTLSKLGDGTGMAGLPGDFTPPSRFIRAAHFVAHTPKTLDRSSAILQNFRILSQMDIPIGAVINPKEGNDDETLYTAVMDSQKKAYFIKCQNNINIQSFYLDEYQDKKEVTFIELKKQMTL